MSAVEVIVLKKSFWGDERKFLEPLMRFARGDMRDHIVSHKNDHGASYRRYGVLPWRSRQKSTFARFSTSFDFRLLQHYRRHKADINRLSMQSDSWVAAD